MRNTTPSFGQFSSEICVTRLNHPFPFTMLCTSSPMPSPAGSEISVGAPSPPPDHHPLHHVVGHAHQRLHHPHQPGDDYFRPLKRLKGIPNAATRARSTSPLSRSSLEGVKSFSIADILGHATADDHQPHDSLGQSIPDAHSNHHPANHHLHHHHLHNPHHLHHHHQTTKIVRPWDHLRGPVPVRPFLPSALLHYEHRLAMDYQRQLQEHLNAQAQLLRHMNMGMDIIPSESGSDRSSSAASDCCSPEISGRMSDQQSHSASGRQSTPPHGSTSSTGNGGGGGMGKQQKTQPNGTPLDALFQMTNKSFEEAQGDNGTEQSHLNLFATRPQPKKKRKSRTAFTNHQIFELEKRFLYQKYLSPADRDEIAASLGLSNAQVITWFQNRRAKLKRDMEELKKDVETVKVLSVHKSFLENVNDLGILKKKPVHDEAALHCSPQK